jgi:hypothetical protein
MTAAFRMFVLATLLALILLLPGIASTAANPAVVHTAATPLGPTSMARTTGMLRGPPTAAPAARPEAAAPSVTGNPTDNLTCYKINASVCISAAIHSYDVVPGPGNLTSSVLPPPNSTLNFFIKSKFPLTWQGAPTACTNITPIRINVTGTLWNGVPYMSQADGTMWNANQNTACYAGPQNGVTNATYKFWYNVTIRSNVSGSPQFFPGEFVSWWVYLVHKNGTGHYSHVLSPVFHYITQGAWAFSPYFGAYQYGGPDAATLDLNVLQNPVVPNWNDTVKVTIETTQADLLASSQIGEAWLEVSAALPNGSHLASAVYDFSLNAIAGTAGQTASATMSTAMTQLPGTVVQYSIVAYDNVAGYHFAYGPDQIVTPTYSFTVNGNGTFTSGIFSDDLEVTTTPASVGEGLAAGTPLAPDTNVSVLLTSRNPGTAILTAELSYIFELPQLRESATGTVFMSRINSTSFTGRLPGIPIGGYLNFTVLAWDFINTLEVSPTYGYSIETFNSLVPTIAPSLTFLWVYVYDNGSGRFAPSADVAFTGSGNYIDIETHAVFGVAYPNNTNAQFSPLLLPANITYNVTVVDPTFYPGDRGSSGISVSVTLRNPSTFTGTLVQTSTYTVVQSWDPRLGNELFFWLNTTGPGPAFSPQPPIDWQILLLPLIGLGAAVLAVVPLLYWWNDIAKRRKEQEKRVTL